MPDHIGVRFMNVSSGKVGDFASEIPLLVDRTNRSDFRFAGNPIIIFSERRRNMNDAGAFVGSDKVRGQHLKELRSPVREIGEEWFVPQFFSNQFAAAQLAQN